MDEIDPTWASSSLVLVVQMMMMQPVSLKNCYFTQNVMHPHTPNKTDHASLIFVVCSSVSFEHLLFSPFHEEHT